jgi:hypothetical protein
MLDEVWLTAVIALSGVVLIVLLAVLLKGGKVRDSRRPSGPSLAPGSSAASPSPSRLTAGGIGYLFYGGGTRRPQRSVESNLERAILRIDSVDPYAAPRRIGLALSEAGLSPEPAAPAPEAPARNPWPFKEPGPNAQRSEDWQ